MTFYLLRVSLDLTDADEALRRLDECPEARTILRPHWMEAMAQSQPGKHGDERPPVQLGLGVAEAAQSGASRQ